MIVTRASFRVGLPDFFEPFILGNGSLFLSSAGFIHKTGWA